MDNNKIKLLLVGIAGTKRDYLLSLPTLKGYLLTEDVIGKKVDIEIYQRPYIERDEMDICCDSILSDIKKIKPDLIGFSVYVWNIDSVLKLSKAIKIESPNTILIYGGPEISANDTIGGRFDNMAVDYLIFGEGEQPLLKLLQYLIYPGSYSLNKIERLAYKEEGCFAVNGIDQSQDHQVLDLLTIPSPYLTGLISQDSFSVSGMRASVETQRGCNLRCAYCMYHKNFTKIRYRNEKVVAEEIEYIYNNGIKEFRITDANFFSNKEFAAYILSAMLRKKLEMSFFIEVIPHFIDEDITDLMGKLSSASPENKITVGLGLQSINQRSLKTIKRNIGVKYFDRAFDLLKKASAVIKTDLILGLPYETKETYFDLLEYIAEKMRYGYNILSLSLLRILPGSDMEAIALKEGMVIDKRDNDHFVYSTRHISRNEMVDCLRMNTVAYRLFSTVNFENRINLRDMYFRVKDNLNVTNIEMLGYFTGFFFENLRAADFDYVKNDFPNAETFYSSKVFSHISDELLLDEFERIEKEGLVDYRNKADMVKQP